MEDYAKGLLDQPLVDEIIRLTRGAGKIVTADPNPSNTIVWHDVTSVTPNRHEAFRAADQRWVDPVDPPTRDRPLIEVGRVLLEKWRCAFLLITLSEQGMMLFVPGDDPLHIPTRAQEVFDVSGAGDTADRPLHRRSRRKCYTAGSRGNRQSCERYRRWKAGNRDGFPRRTAREFSGMTPSSDRPPAIFVDRDGTLMEDVPRITDPDDVRPYPNVAEGLRLLQRSGYRLVMVTNQSAIGRGWTKCEDFQRVQTRLIEMLGRDLFDGVYMCPDRPDVPSARRKPAPGMVFEAERDLNLDLTRSWFIGDKASDIDCAFNAGVRAVQVLTGEGEKEQNANAIHLAKDFREAVEFIVRETRKVPPTSPET